MRSRLEPLLLGKVWTRRVSSPDVGVMVVVTAVQRRREDVEEQETVVVRR